MAGKGLGVADVSAYLKFLIESDDFLSDLWIEGEISDYFVSRNGHIYFTLNDGTAKLRCVMFKGSALRQRSRAQSGDRVVVHGRVSIYEQQGQYQLYADMIQPAGIGIQALEFELLRQRLEADGLFDESRKRPLPPTPHYIGVVTSAEGAVWHDIQQVLRRRYPFAHLILSPTSVQGERAPASIVAALQRLIEDGRAEVVIIGRGGGSAEDLSAFNAELVVRAAFTSPVPVISAVGHETDWTLLDLVADVRAPTPSAAAELVAPSIATYAENLLELDQSLQRAIVDEFLALRTSLAGDTRHLRRLSPEVKIRASASSSEQLRHRLIVAAADGHHQRAQQLDRTSRAVGSSGARIVAEAGARLGIRAAELAALEPQAVMKRGFAVVQSLDAAGPIRSASQLASGQRARISFADGDATTTIDEIILSAHLEDA